MDGLILTRAIAADRAGIGLRTPHVPALANDPADLPPVTPWLEIHSENFLCAGGPRRAMLEAIAARYPISCHGVGLSLGSAEGLDRAHMDNLCALYADIRPALISEHLSWSITGGNYLNDLLPLPYTDEVLDTVCRNVDQAQTAFGRTILVENPSAYLTFPESTMSEVAFLNTLTVRTGCGVLLDANNIYVTATNTAEEGQDPMAMARAYIDGIDGKSVGEIHLAGHSVVGVGNDQVLVDTHSTHTCKDVWTLYRYAIDRIGPRATLIEWDQDIPELDVLLAEAARAQSILLPHQSTSERHAG